MKTKERIKLYKALDFIYREPEKPNHEPILNSDGILIGYRVTNMIKVCNQYGVVPAIPHPNHKRAMLIFGKYTVHSFLLKEVGAVTVKRIKQ